jgi:uncharacterized GH25 family protein
MKLKTSLKLIALCLPLLTASVSHAHRGFLLPTSTVVNSKNAWVSIDAAAASDVFFFDHQPLNVDKILVHTPDGKSQNPDAIFKTKFRSIVDVNVNQTGTYKISLASDNVNVSYKENGEVKRWRGAPEAMEKEVPANAQEVTVTHAQNRIETFVTNGKPNQTALVLTNKGLELQTLGHPNDLIENEKAGFRLLIDGKPAANVSVTVIAGGVRYRQNLAEQTLKTDADGQFHVQWQGAGMYWLKATLQDNNSAIKAAKTRTANYAATLEVLPQ